ncbi:hypothetical protein B0H19DRAFT_1276441 [Mycena capillaripes]|nr:hypothetical protein B0H19DRAFT_1276441 [Mycena capillaripes]
MNMEVDNNTILAHLAPVSDMMAFTAFCNLIPDKYHKALWEATFNANKHWWFLLCSHWDQKLSAAFFPPAETHSARHLYFQLNSSVVTLQQMRLVKLQTPEWVSIIKRTDLGKTICWISDVATLISGKNPHANNFFLKLRAEMSLCETLDNWIREAESWERTPIVFKAEPAEKSVILDPENIEGPGVALFDVMKSCKNDNLVPLQKLPQSVQLFVSEANFEHAWNNWLGISLQARNYDLTDVDPHCLYTTFMRRLRQEFDKRHLSKICNLAWRKILTRTVLLRKGVQKVAQWVQANDSIRTSKNKQQEQARLAQRKQYNLNNLLEVRFPEDACVKCWQLPENQGSVALRWHRLASRGLKFDAIERDEDVIFRCGMQVLKIKDIDGNLIDIAVYEAFPSDIVKVLKKHQHAKSKCRPMKRGAQFNFYGDGDMTTGGFQVPSGGNAGSGYAPPSGFEATTLDGIDIVFNEVEDAAFMLEVMKTFHPGAHPDLMEQSAAADRMGNIGINTYRCTCYCAPQHSDEDVCCSMCIQNELKALKGEFAFCQPTYGSYLQTYENMLWTFLARCLHGTMLPAITLLPPDPPNTDSSLRLRGGAGGQKRHTQSVRERDQRAARRSAKKDGGRVSNGSHGTATSKNVTKAKVLLLKYTTDMSFEMVVILQHKLPWIDQRQTHEQTIHTVFAAQVEMQRQRVEGTQ